MGHTKGRLRDLEGLRREGGREAVALSGWGQSVGGCWCWGQSVRGGGWRQSGGAGNAILDMRDLRHDRNLWQLGGCWRIRMGWSIRLLGPFVGRGNLKGGVWDRGNGNWHTWLIVDVRVLMKSQVGHESK